LRMLARLIFKAVKVRRISEQRVLLVGAGKVGRRLAALLSERSWMGLRVVGFLDDDTDKIGQCVDGYPVLGTLEEASELVKKHNIHEVIIALPLYAHERLTKLVSMLNDTPANVRVVPDFPFGLSAH